MSPVVQPEAISVSVCTHQHTGQVSLFPLGKFYGLDGRKRTIFSIILVLLCVYILTRVPLCVCVCMREGGGKCVFSKISEDPEW